MKGAIVQDSSQTELMMIQMEGSETGVIVNRADRFRSSGGPPRHQGFKSDHVAIFINE
jgi:hypothetical protein